MGHKKKFCRKKLYVDKNNQGPKKQANVAQHKEEEDFFVFMAQDNIDNVKTSTWFIESGASHHFINKRDWYIGYVASKSSKDSMEFGNGEEDKIEEKGNV
jgi:hypothetical protein